MEVAQFGLRSLAFVQDCLEFTPTHLPNESFVVSEIVEIQTVSAVLEDCQAKVYQGELLPLSLFSLDVATKGHFLKDLFGRIEAL